MSTLVDENDNCSRKVFIGGLSWVTTENNLKDYFENKHQTMVDAVVIMRDKIGRSRGFGFVIFSDEESIPPIIGNGHVLDGRRIEVKRAIPKNEIKTKKVFVGGIPLTISEKEFRDYFEDFGKVTEVLIMKDKLTGHPRGFGFVSFEDEDTVDLVLEKENHDLLGKTVEVKKAEPKKQKFDSPPTTMVKPTFNVPPYGFQPTPYYPNYNVPQFVPSYNDFMEIQMFLNKAHQNQFVPSKVSSEVPYSLPPYHSPPMSPNTFNSSFKIKETTTPPPNEQISKPFNFVTQDLIENEYEEKIKAVGHRQKGSPNPTPINLGSRPPLVMESSSSLFTDTPQNNIINSKKDDRHSWSGFKSDSVEHSEAEQTFHRHSWSGWNL